MKFVGDLILQFSPQVKSVDAILCDNKTKNIHQLHIRIYNNTVVSLEV